MIENSTVAIMATFPDRFKTIEIVTKSIIDQLDYLLIYINESDYIPECLKNNDKIIPILGINAAGDIKANGKAYLLDYVDNSYVFIIDDDFLFPYNYVENMKSVIDIFNKNVGVTVHGSIIPEHPKWYYERSTIYGWKKSLNEHKLVNIIGSGTFAFHQKAFNLRFSDFPRQSMVDLAISIMARNKNLPLLAISRPSKWIDFLGYEGLWHDYSKRITYHTFMSQKHGPWGVDKYSIIIKNRLHEIYGRSDESLFRELNIDSDISSYINKNIFPKAWAITRTSLEKRREILEMISKSEVFRNRINKYNSLNNNKVY